MITLNVSHPASRNTYHVPLIGWRLATRHRRLAPIAIGGYWRLAAGCESLDTEFLCTVCAHVIKTDFMQEASDSYRSKLLEAVIKKMILDNPAKNMPDHQMHLLYPRRIR